MNEETAVVEILDDNGEKEEVESDGEKSSRCKVFCTGMASLTSLILAILVVFSPVIIAMIIQHRLQPGTVYIKTDLGNNVVRANLLYQYHINRTISGCLRNISADRGKQEKHIGYLWRNQTMDLSEEKLQQFRAFVIIDDRFSSPMPNLEKFVTIPTVKIHMRDFEEIKMHASSKLLMTAKWDIREEAFPSTLKCGACDRCLRNGHGVCSAEGKCKCNEHQFGEDCSVHCDPQQDCDGRGTCSMDGLSCDCNEKYFGESCSGKTSSLVCLYLRVNCNSAT